MKSSSPSWRCIRESRQDTEPILLWILEMLLQSHDGVIRLLPAGHSFPDGSFTGLRARGNIRVSAEWKDGHITRAVLTSAEKCVCRVNINGETREVTLDPDVPCVINA